jgi:phosphate/sulfate permease
MVTYIAEQWIVWALMGGAIAAIVFLALYRHKLQQDRKPLLKQRDDLLERLQTHSNGVTK